MKSKIFEKMYAITKKPYQRWVKKNEPWTITTPELLEFEAGTLGHELGHFLLTHQFELEPQLEDHDVMHVLSGIGTQVRDEIAMQFYLLGNGKRSLYLYLVIASGSLFYPADWPEFRKAYQRGRKAHRFHDLNFLRLLNQPIAHLRNVLSIQKS